MLAVDGNGLPLGLLISSASPAEIRLADETLRNIRVPRRRGRPRQKPVRVIADRAYDRDPFREQLANRGIELVCPHRRGRVRPKTQDGGRLRRYKRRWKIERTNAWLFAFRRLVVRYEVIPALYRAFLCFACALIVLRWL